MPEHEILPAFGGSVIPHVGTYRRVLPVTLERMYENTLDWEHLPWVHASSFSSIEAISTGSWGWRARTLDDRGHESVIELRLDRACRRWITRTLEGRNQGAEIWTHAFPIGTEGAERVDIVVDFFVPDVAPEDRAKVGQAYAGLYSQLYDEDVARMVARQQQLDRRLERSAPADRELILGPRAGLNLPQVCEVAGRRFVLAELDGGAEGEAEGKGELVCYPATCPHQLGPLTEAALVDGTVTCPWHGYRFDVKSGDCLTGQTCRLAASPVIEERRGQVVLIARH